MPDRAQRKQFLRGFVCDGLLATFDGPARAVRGAHLLCHELSNQGVVIRAGVHTGEIKQWGRLLAEVLVGAGLVDEDHAPKWADVLRAQLWGVFNETRLTGDVSPEQFRDRARQVASLLAPAVKKERGRRPIKPAGTTRVTRNPPRASPRRSDGS